MKTLRACLKVLTDRKYFFVFLAVWFLTVTLFIWLINVNLLTFILSSTNLSTDAKLSFIASAYANYFRYFANPVALSSIIFSFLAAINFTLLIYLWREGSKQSNLRRLNSGAFVAMLGSHCISCGTSLVAPLVTALAGSGAFISAQRATTSLVIATLANLIGITLITWSIRKITATLITLKP